MKEIKFKKLKQYATTPKKATAGAACYDIASCEDYEVFPGTACVISTGIAVEIPENHVMLVFSRSGHAFKHDVTLSNSVGVIDSDYRGEIKVKIRNDGRNIFSVKKLDRIAQALIIPCPGFIFTEVKELSDTERGGSGFGSTN